jgi:hypothetical protein
MVMLAPVAVSVEVAVHEVLEHLKSHAILAEIGLPTLKKMNVIAEIKCCEKSSVIVCVICTKVLFVRLSDRANVCQCLPVLIS